MARNTYAARVGIEWRNFTPQHARSLENALSIARGDHPVPAGAIVGVYGSGKSTLLLAVLARAIEEGILPVWEEAAAFLDRLVSPNDRVAPHDFVGRTHRWIDSIRTDSEAFANYQSDLERRKLGEIGSAVESALRTPTERTVLLLDEMEQAYPNFLKRIETADQQPLRALIDSCGNSKLRLLMAYAPESFHSLGDADRGRMLRLPVPSLGATSIQEAFKLTRGQANFAWWASRGRARGVLKVVEEVIGPYVRGEFSNWRDLPEALDALPSVFGVPAVLRGAGALPRSATTKRRTLAYCAGKPWSSTRSCQMATALRPRASASAMISRYGSHALALGARPGGGGRTKSVDTSWPEIAGFDLRSVDTSSEMAGFGFDSLRRPCQFPPYSAPHVAGHRGPDVFARMGATCFRAIGDHWFSPQRGPGVSA